MSNIGSAAPITQMSQQSSSRLNSQLNTQTSSGNTNRTSTLIAVPSGVGSSELSINSSSSSSSGASVDQLRTQNVVIGGQTVCSSGNNETTKTSDLASFDVTIKSTTTPTVTTDSGIDNKTSNALTATQFQQQLHLAIKRGAASTNADADSIINYKKRNLDHRLNRLKTIKEK